jgi:hypothetical protein
MSRLDPLSQLFLAALQYSMNPKGSGENLCRSAEDWLQAFPDERAGELFSLADQAKDVMAIVPLERSESARLIGVALDRAMKEHNRRLALAGITPRQKEEPAPKRRDRWKERADLQ